MSDWPITVAARSSRTHGRRTLAKLLDAAEAELGDHGYHGARMVRIAKAAGVAHGTLYVYFTDKDDLLAALQIDVDAELRAVLLAMPAIEQGEGGSDALRAWAEAVCGVFQRHAAVLQALAEALNEDEQSPAGRAALRSLRATTGHMASRLRQACGQSDVFDPEIAALCLFALIEGGNRAVFRGELDTTVPVLASEIARFVQRIADPG
ncbi:MAG: TetR/AcrR family transcriptional regulator [Acidimicrobiales bacterium]|jgi:AcrR family transcriptional regulator